MTKDITLDFGLLIAYAVPGSLALVGLASWSPLLRSLLQEARTASSTVGPVALLIGISLVLGMLLSVVRAAWLDRTFRINFRRGILAGLPDHFGRMDRCDPDFPKLASEDRLAAYLEAKASDKRPYQFYGNTLMALPIFMAGILSGGTASRVIEIRWGVIPWVIIGAIAVTLYTAARQSHFRFMSTVAAFNKLESQPTQTNRTL